MTHEAIRNHIEAILKDRFARLMTDETQANYISVVAKIWHELSDIEEEQLEWMDEEDLDEMILTVYYALSRQRHAVTQGVNKEVTKYVKHEFKDWQFAHLMNFND